MKNRKKWGIALCVVLAASGIIAACGGGGGGGGVSLVPVSSLAGTWFGTLEDDGLVLHTLKVTVNANGTVTGELLDGGSTGVTHTVVTISGYPRIYSMAGSDGTSGGFYADSSLNHAVFVDDAGNVGVLEKGATVHPTYNASYATGSWSGFEVELDLNYDIVDMYTSGATVLANGSFSGSNKHGSFSGTFVGGTIDTTRGRFTGSLTSPVSGFVSVFISPDGAFAGGYSCPNIYTWPEDCTFSAWKKQ